MASKRRSKRGAAIWPNARFSQFSIVALYLGAVVIANVTVMIFGPAVSVLNAFLLIGFNLTARDKLHDAWHGQHLKRNMFLLILSGSAISLMFGAGRIAIASFVAFAASESIDAIAYHMLRGKVKMLQINGSNVVSATADSILFPLLAFGWPPLVAVMIGQFLAKVYGGTIWSLIFNSYYSED